MNRITLNVDPKTKIITLIREYGKDIVLKLDDSWNTELTEEIFKTADTQAIDIYEGIITELLMSEEKEVILYSSWGSALSIMIGNTASVVGIDKGLAKQVIILGERHGILYQANNYVWKIKAPEIIRSRWLNKAKAIIKEDKPEKDMSISGILDRYAEQAKKLGVKGFEKHTKGAGSMIVNESSSSVKNEEKSVAVEVIPEEPIQKVNIQVLRQELTKLQKQYDDPNRIDNEECNTFTLIDKMKILKVQITNAEIAENNKQYNRGINVTASGSVTRIERKGVIHVLAQTTKRGHPIMSPTPTKKSLTKGKPAPLKPVLKK